MHEEEKMYKMLITLLCIIIALAYAEQIVEEQSNNEVLVAPQNPEIQAITEKMDRAKTDGDYNLFRTLLKEYKSLNPSVKIENGPQVRIGRHQPTNNPSPLWTGNDITVDSASYDYQAFSMDSRSDAYIYLAAATKTSSGAPYYIRIFSNDVNAYGGTQWELFGEIYIGGHDLVCPSLKIVETQDTTYMFIAYEASEMASPYEKSVQILRYNFVSGDVGTYYISNITGIAEKDPSIDADDLEYPDGPYLYCAFESEDSIVFLRSLDLGETWIDRAQIGQAGSGYHYYDPECAFGWYNAADSFTVGVTWVIYGYGTFEGYRAIRFRNSSGYGVDWLDQENFSVPTDHQDWRASLKMTHGGSPSGVISFARKDTVGTDDEDLCIYYTYDGGRNWTNDTLYYLAVMEMINCLSVDDNLGDFHCFFKGTDDDVRYKEAPYYDLAGGGWSGSIAISDGGDPSDYTSPASAVYNSEPCVCWKDVSTPGWQKIMFDALWLQTGVEERPGEELSRGLVSLAPNPSNGSARLSYIVKQEGHVKISLFDATGRLVETIVNATKPAGEYTVTVNNKNLAAGVYFIRVEIPDGMATKAMTIVR